MNKSKVKSLTIHLGLFLVSFTTATIAGMEWVNGSLIFISEESRKIDWLSWQNISQGLKYSTVFLGVLTIHEFGHYFVARYHKIKTTLPYYIPLWLGFTLSFGSMGAVIRIRETISSRTKYFDVGISGPLAGFVAALILLVYGFTHLPEQEYLLQYNPEYASYGADFLEKAYQDIDFPVFKVGKNLMFLILENTVVSHPERIPNSFEMIHYPIIFAGYLALFFTALNLLPIGQLDGGHITYGLFGERVSKIISAILFICFVTYAGLGFSNPFMPQEELLIYIPLQILLYYVMFSNISTSKKEVFILSLGVFVFQYLLSYLYNGIEGFQGWLFFAFILGRFLGVYHPKAYDERPLTMGRKVLGWLALLIFILCFSPEPFIFEIPPKP